jgi:hypothetical protein
MNLMNRFLKLCFFFLIVGLMSLPAPAAVSWVNTSSPLDSLWTNPLNWWDDVISGNKVPAAGDTVTIDNTVGGNPAGLLLDPLIQAGDAALAGILHIGNTAPAKLVMTGGTLTIDNRFRVAGFTGTSTVDMSGLASVTKNDTGTSSRFGWANDNVNAGTGVLNMTDNANWVENDNFFFGYGGTGILNMSANASINQVGDKFFIGCGSPTLPGTGNATWLVRRISRRPISLSHNGIARPEAAPPAR